MCITLLGHAVKHMIRADVRDLLEPMLATGLSPALTTALRELACSVPQLKKEISEGIGLTWSFMYEGQSNENRTPTTKWQWNLFCSKVSHWEARHSIPVLERGRSLMDAQPHPLLHFLVRMKPTSTNVFLQVTKNVEATRGKIWAVQRIWSVSQPNFWSLSLTRLAVWGHTLSCKRMIPSDRIPGHFDFMACSSTLSH